MERILISGYYGFRNNGDDALLKAIVDDLRKQNPKIFLTVLSKNPKETRRRYCVHAVNRMNPFAVLYALIRCRLLLSGGGTLIQDRTSTKSLLYYLGIIRLAKLFGKKVMLYSNGIGPLREEHVPMTRKVLNRVDLITLRDRAAEEELEKIGVAKPKIFLTADPAFTLLSESAEKGKKLLADCGLDPDRETVCISVRKWKALPEHFCDAIAEAADMLAEQYQILFVPMQPSKDVAISQEIARKMKHSSAMFLETENVGEMLAVLGNMKLCIGMRLHSLIYAASQSVPVIGLVYDPKITGFMDYIGQKFYLHVDTLSRDALLGQIQKVLEQYDEIRSELSGTSEILRKKAEQNARLAEMLQRGEELHLE